jgi:hypothetical protein
MLSLTQKPLIILINGRLPEILLQVSLVAYMVFQRRKILLCPGMNPPIEALTLSTGFGVIGMPIFTEIVRIVSTKIEAMAL